MVVARGTYKKISNICVVLVVILAATMRESARANIRGRIFIVRWK
jgi:hypothetical protein